MTSFPSEADVTTVVMPPAATATSDIAGSQRCTAPRKAASATKWIPFVVDTPAYVPKTGRKKRQRGAATGTASSDAPRIAAKPPRKPPTKDPLRNEHESKPNRTRPPLQRRKKKAKSEQPMQRSTAAAPRKPMSPSAVSTCSLASLMSSSSGIGSGESSRAAVGSAADSDGGIMSPTAVVSSACSTIDLIDEPKFDEDFDQFDGAESEQSVVVTPIPSLLDSYAALSLQPQHCPEQSDADECLRSATSATSTFDLFGADVPPPPTRVDLRDPALRRYYNQQRRFYRQIYEQQFAVYAAVAQAMSESDDGTNATNGTNNHSRRRRNNVPHQHLGLPPLPPPTAAQPTYWPPPSLAQAPPGYVFVPYSQLASMVNGEEGWDEWSVFEEDEQSGTIEPLQQQECHQRSEQAAAAASSTPPIAESIIDDLTEIEATMRAGGHPPHQQQQQSHSSAHDARPHRGGSSFNNQPQHHNGAGGGGGGGQRHTQTISTRSLQHHHHNSQRSGSYQPPMQHRMPTVNVSVPAPSRPASGEGTMCESGYQSESRGSPLNDDAEAVTVEPISRADPRRRSYQQRAHSTSTFDGGNGPPATLNSQPQLLDKRNHGSDPHMRRYPNGVGSSRDHPDHERSAKYSAQMQRPPGVLRTQSQNNCQNYQRPRPTNLVNFNGPSQPYAGQHRFDRVNSFDRGNVENIAIAATVSVPKSTPPTGASANGSQSPFGASSSQAPPNAFPRRVAYQFTSARDHVQSVGTYGLGHHLEISKMDVLSEQILHFHSTVEQPQQLLNRKLQLRDMIYYTIAPTFPMCGLYIVGSSLNGFGSAKSDMDLCLMISNKDLDQRSDAVVVLSSIMRALTDVQFITSMQMILAKVPILRMKFAKPFNDIVVDLNANNPVTIRNTHLLCYYSSFDWRVRPLVSAVKEWAKRHGINDANRSSFTSYSLVLLVIHFLQSGQSPVLPSLQQLYPKRFSPKADVRNLNISIPLDPPPSDQWKYRNTQSLGELLINFLEYYAKHFNFDNDAISVRMGKKTGRAFVARNISPFNHLSQWRCICIEEPFTFSNTAHSVYDERVFQAIKKAFAEGYQVLERTRDLDALLASASAAAATMPEVGNYQPQSQQQPANDDRPQ